jgi:hypothetical protein
MAVAFLTGHAPVREASRLRCFRGLKEEEEEEEEDGAEEQNSHIPGCHEVQNL